MYRSMGAVQVEQEHGTALLWEDVPVEGACSHAACVPMNGPALEEIRHLLDKLGGDVGAPGSWSDVDSDAFVTMADYRKLGPEDRWKVGDGFAFPSPRGVFHLLSHAGYPDDWTRETFPVLTGALDAAISKQIPYAFDMAGMALVKSPGDGSGAGRSARGGLSSTTGLFLAGVTLGIVAGIFWGTLQVKPGRRATA
jgi:hypothetical protein